MNIVPRIESRYEPDFLTELSRLNIRRGKLFVAIICGIEIIVLSLALISHTNINWYIRMYLAMVAVTSLDFIIFSYLEPRLDQGPWVIKAINVTAVSFAIFLMTWGAVISLMDQSQYGNITVFMVNILVGTVMFTMNPVRMHVPQVIASLVLLIGLPHCQSSMTILIGHYVNAGIFIIFCWVMADTNYKNYVQNFINQRLIEEKSVELALINENLKKANEQLLSMSSLDALTGIPNRRKLDNFLIEKWGTAIDEQIPLALMMIDIDFFKLYNDSNGHLAGDHCLQKVASVLSDCRREGRDFAARFGGEEFIYVAAWISREEAPLLAESIRAGIEALHLDHKASGISPYVTVSVGVTWLIPHSSDQLIQSIQLADQAMYQAKREGRNRVVMDSSSQSN